MASVTQLRAAFLEHMKKTLLKWSSSYVIKRLDGDFTSRTGFDGRTIHTYAKNIYHFTPRQWNSEEVQVDIKRLEELAKYIKAEVPQKRNLEFKLPVIVKNVSRMTVSLIKESSSKQHDRNEVLENLIRLRDNCREESLKMKFTEMVGAVRATRDPVLRGRREIAAWNVYYHNGEDENLERIRRLKFGIIHIGEHVPSVMDAPPRKGRKTSYYKEDPIAQYLDLDTNTPWQFWPEHPDKIIRPDFS